ncbi:MAG: phosphoribosylformylglycinamidine synthase I [Candidatus Latescibacteria bacterium]|nr:phosphoribosylformylglycinamidine synthase I [Candidatus Latescibacterota bacterium]
MPSVLVLRAAGINCDHEAVHAFVLAGADRVDLVHINEFIAGRRRLSEYDILMLPGGFSYGDDISAGKVLANELRLKLLDEVEGFIGAGKLMFGVCNGFQVLVKIGLLPETRPGHRVQEATVFFNDSGKFECRWVYLQPNPESPCVFTRSMPETVYMPVAHGEGKIVPQSDAVLDRLRSSGQVALRYTCPPGATGTDGVPYPWNPNGSVEDIAGLCDTTGRLFGLMPHPERHTHPTHHPRWTREPCNAQPDGLFIFQNAVRYVKENL